jgi:5-methylthioadenosine/S-adenosylhomocysteine deaminase
VNSRDTSKRARNAFLATYAEGIPSEIPEAAVKTRDPAEVAKTRDPAEVRGEFRSMRLLSPTPGERLALQGCVITPDEAIENGYVVIQDTQIIDVTAQRPTDIPIKETPGVILPGLIDLHGHPEFNIYAAWEPPHQFKNRYHWQASQGYTELIVKPQQKLQGAGLRSVQARYAEIRALVGGVTAIQGVSKAYAGIGQPLVRNVDLPIFGSHRARSTIFFSGLNTTQRQKLRQEIDTGAVTAWYVHLAEGVDRSSWEEFEELERSGLLTPATVIIHGTALSRPQLRRVKEAGAKLVWSPQSNLRLYGRTTQAAAAMQLGIPIGLGADWQPSGSQSLLAELKVARRALAAQGLKVPAKTLVTMITRGAAEIAGLNGQLGELAKGRTADIIVLERKHTDAYVSILMADPSSVELVMIGGDIVYGRHDWVTELANPAALARTERLVAWGKRMIIDTGYTAESPEANTEPLSLAAVRALLINAYPQIGPIFA